jgi:Dyp-type peroxidase family
MRVAEHLPRQSSDAATKGKYMGQLSLELHDIQGDLLEGLPKDFENFIFFEIVSPAAFKQRLRQHIIPKITSALQVHDWEQAALSGGMRDYRDPSVAIGLNVGFTNDGLAKLVSVPSMLDPAFRKGAGHPDTIEKLNDPPRSDWLKAFMSDRVHGVLLVTGRNRLPVTSRSNDLLHLLGASMKPVYSELGATRPGPERGREHFGFRDGISQPGIRGLTTVSDPRSRPDNGLPGQDLLWPGEFVFGYPGQHPEDPHEQGPAPEMAAPWMRNGSYMAFRRLEQKVPEFRRYVGEKAARLGMDAELLAARMVGRWKSGAPLELTPRRDEPKLGGDEKRNNNFEFGDDPEQRKCPYAGHIRKVYPRDDTGNEADVQRHRINRQGIPFGPEVAAGETKTRYDRGLMFVCYQTSIERQFEYIQQQANNPGFVSGKRRPGGGSGVTPGFDPIIGQAVHGGARTMDEPYPNYPAGNRRTTLTIPEQFVKMTAAAYFFMPSITALRTVLT